MQTNDYRIFTGVNLPITLVERVKTFQSHYRIRTKGEAVEQLLETALFIESKMGLVESWTAKDLENIREQFESGELVDWAHRLELDKFSALMHVFDDESKARGLKR